MCERLFGPPSAPLPCSDSFIVIFGEETAMRLRHWFWIALMIALSCGSGMTAQAGQLLAGAARISITPTADEFPYDGPRDRQFVGVHDEIYTRALVLADGEQQVAIVIIDVTRVPHPVETVKAIAQELSVPASNVLVAASHTHDVPLVEYYEGKPNKEQRKEIERIQRAAVQAVRQAKAALEPARIAFARGEAWVNSNGGSYMKVDKNGKMNVQDGLYFPKGPSDKSLDLIRVESLKGKPLALLVNYATHGEVMFRSVTKDSGYEVSGDLPGAVAHLLEKNPAAAPVVLFTSPAEADQRPLFTSLQPGDKWLADADEGAAGWALLDAQARRLAESVFDTLDGMPPGASDVNITASAGSVTCPGKTVGPPKENAPAESAVPPVNIPLSMIRIDDIALAGIGGDVANEIGQHFKNASPLAHTTVITMTSGYIGYIMTDAYYEDHGFGEASGVGKSPLKAGCAEPAIIKGLLDLMGKGTK